MHFSFFTHPLPGWPSPIQLGCSYVYKFTVTYGSSCRPQLMVSECRLISISAGQSAALRLSCSCRVEQWPCVEFMSCVGGSDRLVVSVSLSGLACIEQSATCLGFVCSLWAPCFLGVTCTFVLKGGEPRGVRDAYGRADYMFCVSSCLWKPAPDAPRETEESESARFPLLMENMPNISPKNAPFICFLPASFGFGLFSFSFFFLNCRRFQFRAAWGFSLLW